MQSVVFIKRLIQVKRSTQLKITKYAKRKLCLACDLPLGKSKVVRGDHEKCAHACYRAIERGETTDEDLVSDGVWLAQAKRGPKPRNAVTIRLRKSAI